jgi:predicted amidohydrolase YtcJ
MGPFKVITDGSLGTRTAALVDGSGSLAWAFDDLVAITRRAVDAGLVPAIHAIGDRANTLALDVGVAAWVQPEHAMDDRDIADRHWAGDTDRAFAFASLVRAGAEVLLGSDAPVAPLDPWVSLAAAVGRDRDGREPWHPAERMSAIAAWRGSTDGRVSVAVGDAADLVLTEADPLAASSAALRSMTVLGTAIAGRWTHLDL